MKKIASGILLLILFASPYIAADEDIVRWSENTYTLTGHSIITAIEEQGATGRENVNLYIRGIVDTLVHTNLKLMNALYPGIPNISEMVIEYYQNNPAQRGRQVVELILSGDIVPKLRPSKVNIL